MEELTRRERERKVREEEIISAAEKLFFEKGFHDTSMDEIAKEAQFTKKTLYQYFINKEDLYFTVSAKAMQMLITYFEKGIENGTSGLDKIRLLSEAYYDYYKDYPLSFRLMNYCQFIQTPREDISHYYRISDGKNKLFQYFTDVFEEGKADGSIRKDLNTKDTVLSLFLLITGFFSRFAELKKIDIDKDNKDHEQFISSTLNLIEHALATDNSAK
jgi:Transcriptional regulator